MSNYQVVEWEKLLPHGTELDAVSESNIKNLGEAIGFYLSMPALKPIDASGRVPGWLQNLQAKHPKGQMLQNFRQARQNVFNSPVLMQNLSTTAGFEEFMDDLKAKFQTLPAYDEGYNMIFRDIPLDGSDGWDVETVDDNITFEMIYPGGDIKYYGHSDTKYRVYCYYYGGGAAIDQRLIETRKFVTIEDLLTALREKAYYKKASVYYGLIEAVSSSQNIAWQNPVPSTLPNTDATYTANRDCQTLNTAVQTIIANCLEKGYSPNLVNQTYIILCPYQLTGRLKRAIGLSLQGYESSTAQLDYTFTLLPTTMLTSSTSYYVILPKAKLQKADLLRLVQFTQFNQTNYTREIADWMAFGGSIGDIQQIQRCAIS